MLVALLPSILLFLIFAVVPAYNLVRMPLSEVSVQNGAFAGTFVGLANFFQIPADSVGRRSILNTLVFALVSVVVTVVVGCALALIVDKTRLLAGFARRVLLLPLAIAPVVISVIALLIADPSIGALNKLFGSLGIPLQYWLGDPGAAMAVVITVDVWHWTPLVFLILYTSIQAIDPEIQEASLMDGANAFQGVRFITLPLLLPMIAAVAGIRFLMSLKAFDEMYLLTGGGPGDATKLLTLHIRDVFFDQLRLGYGSAYSVAVVLAIGVIIGIAYGARRSVGRRSQNALSKEQVSQ